MKHDDDQAIKELLKETIEGIDFEECLPQLPAVITPTFNLDSTADIDDDYKAARVAMHLQLQYFKTAADNALIGLMSSQHPKSVEAFASLMGQMTTTAEKLMKLQKDTKDVKAVKTANGSNNQGANFSVGFTGTTNDLLDTLGDASNPKYILDGEVCEN